MKTYLDYNQQDNCINLGQLCVYNEFLQTNKREHLKKFDGSVFLFLSDGEIKDFLNENFEDYNTYFDIQLIDKDIVKPDSHKKYNVYQLLAK